MFLSELNNSLLISFPGIPISQLGLFMKCAKIHAQYALALSDELILFKKNYNQIEVKKNSPSIGSTRFFNSFSLCAILIQF